MNFLDMGMVSWAQVTREVDPTRLINVPDLYPGAVTLDTIIINASA